MKKVRDNKYTIGYFAILIIIVMFQVFKATRGMGYADEHFYVTLGQDFANGSALFYDNWHIAQLISIFLAPLYNLYLSLFKSIDGIVLGFRVFYIIINAMVAFAFYWRFKRYNIYAIIASAIYVIFVPFNIQALSYNTMSIMFWLVSALCIDYGYRHDQVLTMMIAGVLFACAVMNTPYLAFVYFASLVYVFLQLLTKKIRINDPKVKAYVFFSFGILAMFIVFMIIVFSRATLPEVMLTIKYLIDPSHSSSILHLLLKDGYFVLKRLHIFFIMQILLLLLTCLKKDKEKLIKMQLICNIGTFIYLFIDQAERYQGGLNIVLLPLAMTIMTMLIAAKPKDKLISGIMIFACIHMVLLAISSNVGYRSFLNPMIVFAMGGILYFSSYTNNTYLKIVIFLLVGLLGINNLYIYGNRVFSAELNTKIEAGPLKGLYDTDTNVEKYNNKLKDIDYINSLDEEYASLITYDTWMYLALDKKWSINSSYIYFWEKAEYLNCLKADWEIHDDKLPTIVYLDDD
ncbi:MAG: hypothetical protein MR210_03145, partial [Erysipelotrichaceae bacterium]|nr:hypothetical protein [Erysipelotrichaceae bacterium]